MNIIFQIAFILILIIAIWFFAKKVGEIRRNILLGRDENLSDRSATRWRNVLLLALGQQKMFKKPLVAVFHFLIYAGFIIINIEILEIILDGVFGTHRLFQGFLGPVYAWLIDAFEFLAVGVLVACIVFLARRNILKLWRFYHHDLDGWPRSDANYILIMEIILMTLFLTMNASDTLLQQRGYEQYGQHLTGNFAFSSFLHPLLQGYSNHTVEAVERSCWWLHIVGILGFLNYVPYSKHLHIFLSFPNTYYMRLKPKGQMKNMPEIQKEVLYAMEPQQIPAEVDTAAPHKFGAKDIFDLSWKNLLDAYSCTECGRCTAVCPANITGKKLSPRRIEMSTRDRVEDVGRNINANGSFVDDGKTLLHDYITVEELRACTTCNACVEACPVGINPLNTILELRRYLIMEESSAPAEWNGMFSNVENNFAPWKFSPEERDRWTTA